MVRALKSYNDVREGQVFMVMMSEPIAHLITNHFLQLLEDPAWRSHGHDGEDQQG